MPTKKYYWRLPFNFYCQKWRYKTYISYVRFIAGIVQIQVWLIFSLHCSDFIWLIFSQALFLSKYKLNHMKMHCFNCNNQIKILKRVIVVNGSVVVATFGPVVTSGFLVMQTVCRSSRHGFVDHHLLKINHMKNIPVSNFIWLTLAIENLMINNAIILTWFIRIPFEVFLRFVCINVSPCYRFIEISLSKAWKW